MPTPTPVPPVASMELVVSGCTGGTVLDWAASADPRFAKYVVLRGPTASVPATYPPSGSVTKVAATGDPEASSAADASAPVGTTAYYRVIAIDAEGRTIAASPVRAAVAKPVIALGPLAAGPADGGATQLGWSPYGGPGGCFTYYKVVYSETNPSPSYLAGDPYWAAIGEQASSSAITDAPVSGTTYHVRVQAVRATAAGAFVAGQTEVLTYTVP
jgi:hypothetical protein